MDENNRAFERVIGMQSDIGLYSTIFTGVFGFIFYMIHLLLSTFPLNKWLHALFLAIAYVALWWVCCKLIKRKQSSAPKNKYIYHSVLIFTSYNLLLALIVAPRFFPTHFAAFDGLFFLPLIIVYSLTIDSRHLTF